MTSNEKPKPVLPVNDDPFGPTVPPQLVLCDFCLDEYMSSEMKWDSERRLWVCKNHPRCMGYGYGWKIQDVVPFEEWDGAQ